VLSTYYGDSPNEHILYVDVDVDISVQYDQLSDIEESLNAIRAAMLSMSGDYCTDYTKMDKVANATTEIQRLLDIAHPNG
jgi:hypothetical protein